MPKKAAAAAKTTIPSSRSHGSKQQQPPHASPERVLRQQPQQQQQRTALPPQPPSGDDDLLPAAPPAFPQPVSSLPRDTTQYYPLPYPAYAPPRPAAAAFAGMDRALPVSSSAQSFSSQQPHGAPPHHQHEQPWPPGGAAAEAAAAPAAAAEGVPASIGPAAAAAAAPGAAGLLQFPPPATAAAAAAAAPFGYTVDGLPLPYDVAMAPYTAVYTGGGGGYAGGTYNDASMPLLTDATGFAGADMVFANRQVRHAFVRKVLGLVTLQLLATAGLALPLLSHKPVRRFLHANPWVFFITLVLAATLLLVLACSEGVRRARPANLALLAAFTLAQGAMVGAASATYETHVLVVGLLVSAAVCLALIAYASQTSTDFSTPGGTLFSAATVLLVVGLAEHFLGFKTLQLLIGGCGALLFSAYLVYDVQALASGDSPYAVTADEYVFGTINVFTDVITLPLNVLRVVLLQGGDGEGLEQ